MKQENKDVILTWQKPKGYTRVYYTRIVREIRSRYPDETLNKRQISKLVTEILGGAETTHYYNISRVKE